MRNRINPITVLEAHEAYMASDSMSVADVARRFGINPASLNTCFLRRGLPAKRKRRPRIVHKTITTKGAKSAAA